jgi:predicted nucleotidyltransferase
MDGIRVKIVNIDDLIQSKRTAGRPIDLDDASVLEMIRDKKLERPTTQE